MEWIFAICLIVDVEIIHLLPIGCSQYQQIQQDGYNGDSDANHQDCTNRVFNASEIIGEYSLSDGNYLQTQSN